MLIYQVNLVMDQGISEKNADSTISKISIFLAKNHLIGPTNQK